MFLDCYEVLILKINSKKQKKILFNVFPSEKYFENNHYHNANGGHNKKNYEFYK